MNAAAEKACMRLLQSAVGASLIVENFREDVRGGFRSSCPFE